MHQLDIAIVLIVVDINTKAVYWKSLQDDKELMERLSKSIANGNKTMAVHLPTENKLPDASDALISAVTHTMDWLKIIAFDKIQSPIADMVRKSSSELISDLIKRNKEFNFHLYNEQYERLLKEEKYQELYNLAIINLKSLSELVETRFNSGIYVEKVIVNSCTDSKDEKNEHLYNLYNSLVEIVREGKGDKQLRMYSIFLLRSFILKDLIDLDYHSQLTKIQIAEDPLTSLIFSSENNKLVIKTATSVQKIIVCLNRLLSLGNYNIFVTGILRSCVMLSVYAHRLNLDDKKTQSDSLYNWLGFCLDIAMGVSKDESDQTSFANLIILYARSRINCADFELYIERARVLTVEIKDIDLRSEITALLDKMLESKKKHESKISEPEEELKFFTERAIHMGFKIDDQNDRIGQIIRQGLDDYNPERVIKNCESMLMMPSRSLGIPAQMLGLYSAAMKYLVCTKKNFIMGGWRLDEIYINQVSGFKREFCDKCNECKPRPTEWHWTMAWQESELLKHKSLLDRIDRW